MKHCLLFLFMAFFSLEAAVAQKSEEPATVYIAHLGPSAKFSEVPVFHDSEYIGSVKGKKVIRYKTAPGSLSFTGIHAETGAASSISLEASPGKTYYIAVDLKEGAYQTETTPDNQRVHYFLNEAIGEEPSVKEIQSLVKKNRFSNFSKKEKRNSEALYAALLPTNGETETSQEELLADAGSGPVNISDAQKSEVALTSIANSIMNSAQNTGSLGITGTTESAALVNPTTESNAEEGYEFGTNKRELAYKQIVDARGSSSYVPVTASVNTVLTTEESDGKISRSEDNETAELKYRRSSLYTMMINDTVREHFQVIKDAFGNSEISEKFNDHNIGPYLINSEGGERDQSDMITAYLQEQGVARKLVAKWFNRNEKGEFNMDLIADRGSYNASDLDVMIAGDSKRGSALLEDAGVELIGNTFVIVNDYMYVDKEKVAEKASGFLSAVSTVASVAGYSDVALIADATNLGTAALGKGYVVKTTSYLYRLEWNEEVANEFYTSLWIDDRNFDASRKAAFENTDLFKLRLVGSQSAWADLQSTAFTRKSDQDLIRIATVKATDKAISKLQREYEEFRTKSPLFSGDPIAAKIGLKEGIEKGDRFEVLEQVIDKNGRTSYKRVGKIKVDAQNIWDNSYMAAENEEASSGAEDYTVFKGSEDKYYSGMLIRQIN